MKNIDNVLQSRLDELRAVNMCFTLTDKSQLIDFCSNDYFGFSRSEALKKRVAARLEEKSGWQLGSGGSRALTNTAYVEELEQHIARFHGAEGGLLFNSGYDANLGLMACIAGRGDTIIYDEKVHNSCLSGIRLGFASRVKFEHNNLDNLETKLKTAEGNIFVAIESIYSMDGDIADIQAIVALCERYGANLIVDEAHSTGIMGPSGAGLVVENNLQDRVFARVHTFGKAMGTHGAIVVGKQILRDYLISCTYTFLYSTFIPIHNLITIACAYEYLQEQQDIQQKLMAKVKRFKTALNDQATANLLKTDNAILPLIIPGVENMLCAGAELDKAGFYVGQLYTPAVPVGKERFRICIHLHNSDEEIAQLAETINGLPVFSSM